jgi:hypothetical protein
MPNSIRYLPLRFLALHSAIGFGLAALFMAALLLGDPGGIGTLLRQASQPAGPILLLWVFTGLTFASAQFGAAVMLLQPVEPQRPRRRAGRRR